MALFINGVGQDSFNMNGVSIDNLYVDDVLVWSLATDVAPIYLMTELLEVPGDGFEYLFNGADSGEQFNGKLLTSGDTAWSPTTGVDGEYPQNGTIDFGTNKADTQWVMPADELLTFTFVDSVENNSYRMISLVPQGDGVTANVLYDGVLDPVDTGLLYTPPLTPFVLDANTAITGVPSIPTCVVTMSQYTFGVGDTATVTFTHNVDVVGFDIGYINVPNGALSNWTVVAGNVYTATFTPDEEINDDTNIISTLGGSFYDYYDNFGNKADTDFHSPNYTVNTVTAPALGDSLWDNSYFTDNIDGWVSSTGELVPIWNAGAMDVSNNNTAYNSLYITCPSNAPLDSGKTYRLTINILEMDDCNVRFWMGSFLNDISTPGIHTYDLTGTGTVTNRLYFAGQRGSPTSVKIDEYTIQEVL